MNKFLTLVGITCLLGPIDGATECDCDSFSIQEIWGYQGFVEADITVAGKLFDMPMSIWIPFIYNDPGIKLKKNQPFPVTIRYAGIDGLDRDRTIIQLGCGVEEVEVNGVLLKVDEKYPSGEHVVDGNPVNAIWGKPVGDKWEATLTSSGCAPSLTFYSSFAMMEGGGGSKTFSVEVLSDQASSTCSGGSDGEDGTPEISENDLGEFRSSFDVGVDENGVSPGPVTWRAPLLEDGFDIASLTFAGKDLSLPGIWWESTATRLQIKSQTVLFDAQETTNGMVIKAFNASDFDTVTTPPPTQFYDLTGKEAQKTAVFQYSWQNLQIMVSDVSETPVGFYSLERDSTSGRRVCTDELSGIKRAVTIEDTWLGGDETERHITREEWRRLPSSTAFELVSNVITTYIPDWRPDRPEFPDTPGGFGTWFPIRTVVDPGGANITTETEYNDDGVPFVTTNSDGSWTARSEFNVDTQTIEGVGGLEDLNWDETSEEGSITSVVYRPWLDSTLSSSGLPDADTCVAELDIYLGDGVTRQETRVLGITTRRVDSWTEFLMEGGTGPEYQVDFTRTWNSGTAGDYLDSSIWSYTTGDWSGRTYKVVNDDGTVKRFAYANIAYTSPLYVAPHNFTGPCLETIEWQDGSGLRSVRTADEDGRPREKREEIDTGGGTWEAMTKDVYSYDIDLAGRVQSESAFKGGILVNKTTYISSTETLESSMGSPAMRTIRDREGSVLSVTEEVPGRANIVTTYSSAGRTNIMTRSAGELSESTISVVDVAGRTVSTTDERGITKATTYDEANRTVTVTRPGGVTEISTNYVDGQQKSRSGTGVITSFRAYAVDGNGFISATEHTGSSDNSSLRIATTVAAWSGRSKSSSRPSPTGSGTATETYHYDSGTGRLMRVSNNMGLAARVFAYDSQGRVSLSGLDLNTGAVAADEEATLLSSDRLTGTTVTYEKSAGIWSEVKTTRRYHTPGSADAYVTVRKRALTPIADGTKASWKSVTVQPGGATVTTLRIEDLATCKVEETADLSTTTLSPDMEAQSTGGWLDSSSEYGTTASSLAYDALGRVTAATNARSGTTRTVYNGAGQIVRTSDHAQNTTVYEYYPVSHESAGLQKKITNPEQETTDYTYDTLGRVITVSGTGSYPLVYGYNAWGEMNALTTYPSGGSGETTTWLWDSASGVMKEKAYPGGKKTVYAYHAHGKPSKRTWARASGAVFTDYSYTVAGDLKKIDYSDSTPDVVLVPDTPAPDRLGRPATVIDGGGQRTITYDSVVPGEDDITYSATHAVLPGVTIDRTWDQGTGLRTISGVKRGSNWDQKSVYGYDVTSGRLGSVTAGSGGSALHEYSYDAGTSLINGIKHKVPSTLKAEQKRRIDPAGRLYAMETLDGSGSVLQRHAYKHDRAGRRTKLTREDGAYWDYGYNERGELISGKKKLPGGAYLGGHQFEYSYDAIGNRDWAKLGGDQSGDSQNLRTIDYSANGLNQYGTVVTPYGVDVIGRSANPIVEVNQSQALRQGERFHSFVTPETSNASHPLWVPVTVDDGSTQVTGYHYVPKETVQPQYDDDGNLTSDGCWEYEWDAENRLTVVKTNVATQQTGQSYVKLVFSYDGLGRRVRKQRFSSASATTPSEDRRFAYDGWNLVAEYTASGSTLTPQLNYSWGLDLSGTEQGASGVGGLLSVHQANGTLAAMPTYDGNGNITGWLDAAGALVSQMEYDPFGNRIVNEGSFESPFGFSTKYQDKESKLYYYGYRFYQAEHGRWLSKDPIEESGGENLFGFVKNDGINLVDFRGLEFYAAFVPAAFELNNGNNPEYPIKPVEGGVIDSSTTEIYLRAGQEAAKKSRTKAEAEISKLRNMSDEEWKRLTSGGFTVRWIKSFKNGDVIPPDFSGKALDVENVDRTGTSRQEVIRWLQNEKGSYSEIFITGTPESILNRVVQRGSEELSTSYEWTSFGLAVHHGKSGLNFPNGFVPLQMGQDAVSLVKARQSSLIACGSDNPDVMETMMFTEMELKFDEDKCSVEFTPAQVTRGFDKF